jgi:S1-C subfamily serine protease
MVLLKGDEGKVEIAGFPEGSVSEKAGMKAGDIIRSIGSTAVGSVEDVKIDLLFRKKGEVVRVVVLRKTLLEGDQEMDFEVALQ